jgi:hypothetical protein
MSKSPAGFRARVIGRKHERLPNAFRKTSFGFAFVYELPSTAPDAIIPMEFNRHEHFGSAVFAIPTVLLRSEGFCEAVPEQSLAVALLGKVVGEQIHLVSYAFDG